ncbi:NO-inducible flavohemoprotein, partial [Achromobacter anxifer]|uniref:NO-inducible flavohemoprotein n=1 Tax=Achromobacter anxifer TaxID=1287737 RepID=UPI0023F87F8E
MLSPQIRALVKGTAPVLKTHGVALTKHFYARMFQHNPELKHVFNQGHQAGGEQQQALAGAVAAYAEHIDDPSVLMPVVTRIVHKHVSLGIRPEHYQIVGKHLLASIKEVLGEAATDELVDAWAAAYGQLADLLIAEEARLYAESAAKPGGWTGWRAFRVVGKQRESAEITSFYLAPADGGAVPAYRPGQYVSVRVFVPELGLMQPRQYSLSDAPGQDRLRISVKREAGGADTPAGRVSNALHDRLEEGGVIDVAPPQGDFHLREEGNAPVVLLSGGVGLTPMVSILNHLVGLNDERQIRFVHGCRNSSVHAMKEHVNSIAAERGNVRKAVFYEEIGQADQPGRDYDHAGRVDLLAIRDEVIVPDADYYLCGPAGF